MTLDHEARVQAAVAELADALLAAMRAEQVPDLPDRLLSINRAAALLGISRTKVYGEMDAGRLRSLKVGRRRLIPSAAIAEFAGGQ